MSLVAENLSVERDGRSILDHASLTAAQGEFIAVVGANGAGKSTLLKAFAGIGRLAKGAVRIDGADVLSLAPRERARRLAYLPQARDVHWSITVEAVVALGRFAYGSPHRLREADRLAVDRALAAAGMTMFRERVALTLSGGEQARMHLARAVAAETSILIADEPTAALDLRHALAVMAMLRTKAEAGGLVIAALHDLDLAARHCSRLIVLDRGRIVADGPPHLALDPARLKAVFSVERDGPGYRLSP
jgi:iron complex transport system ATP-binding protein